MKTNLNDSGTKKIDTFQDARVDEKRQNQIKGGEDVIVVTEILTI
ncbi:MAG: hypothetical protein AAFZ15_19810 [Bacteroidota bacterium]